MQETKKTKTNLTHKTHPELTSDPDELFYRQRKPSFSKHSEEGKGELLTPSKRPDAETLSAKEPSISDVLSSVIAEKGISPASERPRYRKSNEPLDDLEENDLSADAPSLKRRFAPALFVLFFVSALVIMIHVLGLHFYSMHTRSMERTIPVGSLVVSTSVPTYTLMVGDVITFRNSLGILITHQIYDIQPNQQGDHAPSFVTKGTENPTPDREVVHSDQVVGRVLFHIPRVGGFLMFFRGLFGPS